MSDGPALETYANHANNSTTSPAPASNLDAQREKALRRALVFVGIAIASAGLAFAIVRTTLVRPPSDPTTERIQALIDEANRLLKALDEKTT
jgi:hypothetical protein